MNQNNTTEEYPPVAKHDPDYLDYVNDKKKVKLYTVNLEYEVTILATDENDVKDIFLEQAFHDLSKYDCDININEMKYKTYGRDDELPYMNYDEVNNNYYIQYCYDNQIRVNKIFDDLKVDILLRDKDPNQIEMDFEEKVS